MGSIEGVIKVAAKRIGVSIIEWHRRQNSGEKWCTGCKTWHDRSAFRIDQSRFDGLSAVCDAPEHHENVEIVCSSCHHKREIIREQNKD